MSPLPLPPVAAPYQLPFHYGALHNIGLDFLVDPEPAREILAKHHPALSAADFGGRALLSVNFQLYFAQYRSGAGVTQEIEVNLVAYPSAAAGRLPEVSYADYAQGHDQTKLLGIARIHVLCDNPLAIDAGRRLYAEPKYPAWFEATMPSLNGPEAQDWQVTCRSAELSPQGELRRGSTALFSLEADLTNLWGAPVNNTPITGYGTDEEGRALAGPMNVYAPYTWHSLADGAPDPASEPAHDRASGRERHRASDRARLTVLDAGADVGRDLERLLGGAPAVGAWSYQSPPVAAHNRPYYLGG